MMRALDQVHPGFYFHIQVVPSSQTCLQAQQLVRKALRDTMAEEEDPDHKYKNEDDDGIESENEKPRKRPGKGRGRGRGGRKGNQDKVLSKPPTHPAAQQLEQLPVSNSSKPDPTPNAEHPLPEDLAQAAEVAEHLAEGDVKTTAASSAAAAAGPENVVSEPSEEPEKDKPKRTAAKAKPKVKMTPKRRSKKRAPMSPKEKKPGGENENVEEGPGEHTPAPVEARTPPKRKPTLKAKPKGTPRDKRPATPVKSGTPQKRSQRNQEPDACLCYDSHTLLISYVILDR